MGGDYSVVACVCSLALYEFNKIKTPTAPPTIDPSKRHSGGRQPGVFASRLARSTLDSPKRFVYQLRIAFSRRKVAAPPARCQSIAIDEIPHSHSIRTWSNSFRCAFITCSLPTLPSSISSSSDTQEAGSALVIPIELRVSMSGDDRLFSDVSQADNASTSSKQVDFSCEPSSPVFTAGDHISMRAYSASLTSSVEYF
ncbi:hypothetical protein EVAR_81949_1 [Eumeta japonica]|uniref:Uncharacterized protein n=1 Tax=Eumeta variegata TaxID=151549 RepID=A0A4C1ZIA4_EUMVA|nr:hypothetical protein EVAR_81949_1 [Eumeta japonica]